MFSGNKVGLTDFTGKANNCTFLDGSKLASEACISYVLPGEEAMFLLKSQKDEYLFTDQGLIFSDGETVTSPKRTITRTNWAESNLRGVVLITAGLMDNDISISFHFEKDWRLEMRKEELENGILVVKVLESISKAQIINSRRLDLMKFARGLTAKQDFHINDREASGVVMAALRQDATDWVDTVMSTCMPVSFKEVMSRALFR